MALAIIGYLLLAVSTTFIIWKGSNILESTSEKLSVYYGLPAIVQGAIIAAIGSSFPELSTTVLSTLIHGKFELGVAAIVGSAIFNILIIPALSRLFSKTHIQSSRDLVYKETQFYMLSVALLLLIFSFAVIYNPVAGDGVLLGKMNRVLAAVPILFYLLYIFIQHQDTADSMQQGDKSNISNIYKEWGLLILSLGIIVVGVEGLVHSAIGLGNILNTPSFLWGLTIVAIGTSIPDALVSIKSARKGNHISSLANILGSNTFDLLVAIPAGILVAGSAVINFSLAAPMIGVLILATIALFIFLRTRMEISTVEAWGLIAFYVVFIGWMALETFGVTGFVL